MVSSLQGQPSRLRNLRTSRWPWAAASTHASESHSTLSDSLNHWRGRGERVRVFRFGGGDFRLRLRPHLDHVQVAPRSGVEQDFVGEPRAGRVLLPAPLEGLEVAALARAVAGVLVPRALGVLRPRPLQDLQREEGRGGRPENFVSAPAVLIRGNASAAALTSRWPCQAAAAQVSLSQGHLGSCDLAHCRISSDPVAAA